MGDRTPIYVAAIGLIGTITVGLLANADKLRGLWGHEERTAGVAAPSAPPADRGMPVVPDAVATSGPAATGESAGPPSTPAATGSLTGAWASDDGYRFVFRQNGHAFSYLASQGGASRGGGDGTISARRLTYGFTSPDGDGACTATLSADGAAISGRCHMGDAPDKSWPMSIRRIADRG